MKFLLWLIIIGLVIAWIKRGKKAVKEPAADHAKPAAPSPVITSERMLQCARCGVHLPASEAIADARGSMFCSEEHRQQTFSS